jgi:hypothetical protein
MKSVLNHYFNLDAKIENKLMIKTIKIVDIEDIYSYFQKYLNILI